MRFEQTKGRRFHKQFSWITNHAGLWWVPCVKKWLSSEEIPKDHTGYGSCYSCKTLRAFRRHLRKHPEIRGKAILTHRYRNCDIYA